METFVAARDGQLVGIGRIHGGEAFPASEVTPGLLATGYVRHGVGPLPKDPGSHGAFSIDELLALGLDPAVAAKTHVPPPVRPAPDPVDTLPNSTWAGQGRTRAMARAEALEQQERAKKATKS